MAKRMVLMLVVILALLGGLGFVKFKQVEAAIEQVPMEMHVFVATVRHEASARAEIAATAWVGTDGVSPGSLAPAIRNHVLPALAARGLIA